MSLLTDLQNLAEHLSPSDVQADGRVVGALVKVLEHEGLKVPELDELLPEEHPARVAPPAPAAPAAQQDTTGLSSRLSNIEAALAKLLGGHQTSVEQASEPAAGAESPAPSSEPAAQPAPAPADRTDTPELDRP